MTLTHQALWNSAGMIKHVLEECSRFGIFLETLNDADLNLM